MCAPEMTERPINTCMLNLSKRTVLNSQAINIFSCKKHIKLNTFLPFYEISGSVRCYSPLIY